MLDWLNNFRINNYIKSIDISNTKLYTELDPSNVIKIIVSPLRTQFTKHAHTHNCLLMYKDDICIMVNLISYDIIVFFSHLLDDNDKEIIGYDEIDFNEFKTYNIGNYYQIEERYKLSDISKHNDVLREVTCEDFMRTFIRVNRCKLLDDVV